MKGELTLKILEFLEEGVTTIIDLGAAVAGGGSIAQVQRKFEKYHFKHPSQLEKSKELVQKRNKLAKLLYKLKKEGLITEKGDGLKLTFQGRRKLDILRKKLTARLPVKDYPKEKDDKFKIIIFDIPESQRHKRAWLRSVLISLDFSLLQKSVWFGKSKIPQDLIEDLEKLELLPFVEIFEVSKTGSIKLISGK